MRGDDRPDAELVQRGRGSSSAWMPLAAAEAMHVREGAAAAARDPARASICRRRRMAAFCSAMLSSWNQIPWTWSARGGDGRFSCRRRPRPRSTGSMSGLAHANQLQQQIREQLDDFGGVRRGARGGRIEPSWGDRAGRERMQTRRRHTTLVPERLARKRRGGGSRAPACPWRRGSHGSRCRGAGGGRRSPWRAAPGDTCGSRSKTSSPAPAMAPAPERRHQGRLVHHVAPRRVDQNAHVLIRPSRSAFIRCRVSGVAGQWRETKSASSSTSSSALPRLGAERRAATSGGGG